MKYLTILCLFIFTSCSSHSLRKSQSIENSSEDALSSESLGRYGNLRLNNLQAGAVVSAYKLCHQGDISRGLKSLQKLIDGQRKNPQYWNKVGSCYYLNNELNKALIYFQYANTHAKRPLPSVMNNLALIFIRKGMYNDAKKILEKIIKTNPGHYTTRFNLAHLYLKFGLVDKAILQFRRVYKKSSKDPEVIAGLSCFLLFKRVKKNRLKLF